MTNQETIIAPATSPTATQKTAVYVSLICIALVMSTVLVLSLVLNQKVFVAIFAIYLTGCFTYQFAFYIIKRNILAGDIRFNVAEYVALFNMILCPFIFIISFLLPKIRRDDRNRWDQLQ